MKNLCGGCSRPLPRRQKGWLCPICEREHPQEAPHGA
jgi:uncharacterized Zn finger protein (UPF0148 family)